MVAKVTVSVQVVVALEMPHRDNTVLGVLRQEARTAAIHLVQTGMFHANRENKGFNDPKLIHEGRDVPVTATATGPVIIIE